MSKIDISLGRINFDEADRSLHWWFEPFFVVCCDIYLSQIVELVQFNTQFLCIVIYTAKSLFFESKGYKA